MQQLRVGLIGCGAVARWHAASLLRLGATTIVGIVDPNEENIAKMRRSLPPLAHVPVFTSDEELYNAVELDAVEVNTPHTMHYPQVITAVERGLHVICEKPLACTPEHAREIAAAAAEAGVVVMVSYQRRLDPAYMYMRQVVADGEIGDIRTIVITCGQSWKKGTTGSWRQNPLLSGGGMLMDSGSHLADVLLWLVDQPVEWVAASVDNLDAPVDINSVATVRFAGGTQGQLTCIGDLPTTWIESVVIAGSEGVLRYEIEPQHPWRTGRVLHYRDGTLVQPLNLPPSVTPDEAWLNAIRGRSPNPAPPEAGVRFAELAAAIYEAGQTGMIVRLEKE